MKTLIDGFGKTVQVADGDVQKSLALLKDAGKDFRVATSADVPAPPADKPIGDAVPAPPAKKAK